MSEAGEGNGHGTPEGGAGEQVPEDAGVLANLPRTRPQRASARRAAARRADATRPQDGALPNGNGRAPRSESSKTSAGKRSASKAGAPAPSATRAKAPRAKAAKTAAPKASRKRPADDVPRQGYESVEERATGPVQPPGGTELIGTAAEVVSELAKAGLSGGERVVRDLLSRLGR